MGVEPEKAYWKRRTETRKINECEKAGRETFEKTREPIKLR